MDHERVDIATTQIGFNSAELPAASNEEWLAVGIGNQAATETLVCSRLVRQSADGRSSFERADDRTGQSGAVKSFVNRVR